MIGLPAGTQVWIAAGVTDMPVSYTHLRHYQPVPLAASICWL